MGRLTAYPFFTESCGLSAEIPAAVSRLEIARARVEIRAVDVAAIAVPGRAPWRRPVGRRAVIGRRRWGSHIDGGWRQRASHHSADTEAEQACANGIAVAGLCRRGHRQRECAD